MDHELLQQFKAWKASTDSPKSDFIEHLKSKAPWVFAHHPAHACFREHVWKINGLYICKGCLVTSAGFAAGALLYPLTHWLQWWPEEVLGVIFVAMLLPTVLASVFRWPRPIRHVARFLLGLLMASALILVFVTERWEVRGVIFLTFIVFQGALSKKRLRQNDEHLARCS